MSYDAWKAMLDVPLDKLVVDGVQPLYVDGPTPSAVTRGSGVRTGVCMRVEPSAKRRPGAIEEDVDGGADALWIDGFDLATISFANRWGIHIVTEVDFIARPEEPPPPDEDAGDFGSAWLGFDPIAAGVRGTVDPRILPRGFLKSLVPMAQDLGDERTRTVRVSGLPFHEGGADAVDELALMLSTMVAYLKVLDAGDVHATTAASQLWFQISVGRDTFGEVCKLRALRLCAAKILMAGGATSVPPIHAVCSTRAQTQRDPWVNMLRGTTEIFAAMLGGADLVTPLPFDSALGPSSAHARRVARNAALVLREESHLGRVVDPAGGSYYIESRTDALARDAWGRFQTIEKTGGIVDLVASGKLREVLDASWAKRAVAIGKRKEPILGVSEFANLDEQLPDVRHFNEGHRDAEGFEELRTSVEGRKLSVVLVTLGDAKEHRARVGFASALFATVGLRATESATPVAADIVCICGSDERYATEAVAMAKQLHDLGAKKIVLAGRPGTLEAELKTAGVGAFLFMGSDVLATLKELVS